MSLKMLLSYALAIIINDNNEVLLGRRANTEWFADYYGLLGGKIEHNESATHALVRELYEELGVTVDPQNVQSVHVMHFYGVDTMPCIALFFVVRTWQGEIQNKEPHKNVTLEWFPLDNLPTTMIPRHAKALQLLSQGIFYSEDNWPT